MSDNKKFEWTDELEEEFCVFWKTHYPHWGADHFVDIKDKFKQSKLQSQDKQIGWEIVEFKTKDGHLAIKQSEPRFGLHWRVMKGESIGWCSYSTCIEDYNIHSVKRLSDGEVFTIGDEVRYKLNPKSPFIITNFLVKGTDILARSEGNNICEFVDDNLEKTPKPSSIDRIEPMPETKYMGSFEAYTSGVSYGVNWCKKYGIPKDLSEITSAKTTQPKEEDKPVIIEDNDRCGICGGEMVYIRGRYPNTDKRKVCPTCTTERLEQISDLCSPEYGKAYQNKN